MNERSAFDDAPRTGVALLLSWQGRLLVGRRIKPPQEGHWQLPGGWIRHGETPQQAIGRQIAAFGAIQCEEPRFVGFSNNLFDDGLHSISLYFEAACTAPPPAGDALKQNTACRDWQWARWNALPQPLFLPLQRLTESGFTLS